MKIKNIIWRAYPKDLLDLHESGHLKDIKDSRCIQSLLQDIELIPSGSRVYPIDDARSVWAAPAPAKNKRDLFRGFMRMNASVKISLSDYLHEKDSAHRMRLVNGESIYEGNLIVDGEQREIVFNTDRLTVRGKIVFKNCKNQTHFPVELSAGEMFTVLDCPSILKWPRRITADRTLIMGAGDSIALSQIIYYSTECNADIYSYQFTASPQFNGDVVDRHGNIIWSVDSVTAKKLQIYGYLGDATDVHEIELYLRDVGIIANTARIYDRVEAERRWVSLD